MLCACLRRALGGQAVVRACVTCLSFLGGNPLRERVQKNPEHRWFSGALGVEGVPGSW